MQCPHCGAWSEVLETRKAELFSVKRRRECANGHRFETFEVYPQVARSSKRDGAATARRVERAATKFRRDIIIYNDKRSVAMIATKHRLTPARVRQIKAEQASRLAAIAERESERIRSQLKKGN